MDDLKLTATPAFRARLQSAGIDPQEVLETMADLELNPTPDCLRVCKGLGLTPEALVPSLKENLLAAVESQSKEDLTPRRDLLASILKATGFDPSAAPKLLALWGIGAGVPSAEQRAEMAICARLGLNYLDCRRSRNLPA